MKQLPLSGVIIVSTEHVIAAPFCTRQLADYFLAGNYNRMPRK